MRDVFATLGEAVATAGLVRPHHDAHALEGVDFLLDGLGADRPEALPNSVSMSRIEREHRLRRWPRSLRDSARAEQSPNRGEVPHREPSADPLSRSMPGVLEAREHILSVASAERAISVSASGETKRNSATVEGRTLMGARMFWLHSMCLVGMIMGIIMGISSDSIRVVGESDFLELARVARSTLQHSRKANVLQLPENGVYREADLVATICVARIIEPLSVPRAAALWHKHGSAVQQACLALPLSGGEMLDLVIDTHTLNAAVASQPSDLAGVVHATVPAPRAFLVVPLAPLTREARSAYWLRAVGT